LVTTFSRHSWLLLQRMATRVTSIATFLDEDQAESFFAFPLGAAA